MIAEERVTLPAVSFSTRVLKSGQGPPVLLLHGSPDSASEWRKVMDALGAHRTCFAPDLPGLGECDEPPASFDFTRQANDAFLDALLAALPVSEPIVLAVHDIGGVYGLPWAARRLDRIRGVVITNTVAFERFPWFGLGRIWGASGPLGRAAAVALMSQFGWFGGAIFRAVFARLSPELSSPDLDRIVREFALDGKSKRSTLRLFRKMIPHSYFDGFDAMMRELIARVPVRVVWGRGDPYIPERFADAFPGAQCEIVEHGRHWIPISAAERVAAAIRAL